MRKNQILKEMLIALQEDDEKTVSIVKIVFQKLYISLKYWGCEYLCVS